MGDFRKFPFGQVVSTPGAREKIDNLTMLKSLKRHGLGDWGDLDDHDKRVNEDALVNGGRLMSSYKTDHGTEFWIITEWDRSVTTILLPEEY